MSTTIMGLCWPIQAPPTAKAVLIALANQANDHGYCWPSQASIARRTCLSTRAIRNAIKWLEEAGYLITDRSNGRRSTYTVTPARGATPEPGAGAERRAADPGTSFRQPRHLAPPNRKEPSGTVSKEKKRAPALGCPEGVDAGTWADWLLLRKAKRAPVTTTVLAGIQREAAKAGITLEEVLQICCLRGWVGLKADWLTSIPVGVSAGRESVAGRAARLAREGDERERRQMRTAGSWPESTGLVVEMFS